MTEVSPTEFTFGRPLRSQLDLLHPSFQSNVIHRQEQQKHGHDQRVKERFQANKFTLKNNQVVYEYDSNVIGVFGLNQT